MSTCLEILQARILEWVAIHFSRGSFLTQGTSPCLRLWQVGSLPSEPPGRRQIDTGWGKFVNTNLLLHLLLTVGPLWLFQFPHILHGEGNGTPLQYSCLENPKDRGAWWAAVHGVAKSRTRLRDFTFHFSLSCIGEGNGNPLQCSCLENPRDGGAWWAAVYGVAQSRTWLKWLSSSSSISYSLVWEFYKKKLYFGVKKYCFPSFIHSWLVLFVLWIPFISSVWKFSLIHFCMWILAVYWEPFF